MGHQFDEFSRLSHYHIPDGINAKYNMIQGKRMQTTNSNFSDAKKIQRVISNILDKEAVFKNGHWSSAVNFERRLANDGFVPACPISHQRH